MNWRGFTQGLNFFTFISGGALIFLTFFMSPEKGQVFILIYFASVFLFAMGASSLLLFYYKKWRTRNEMIFANMKTAVRQGFFFATYLVSLLVMSSMDMLTLWDASILTIIFVLIELFFKSRR